MKKARLYSTIWAILGGLVFAYVLVQVQYGDPFLLGDVMRLALPDNFVWVYYRVDTGSISVSTSPMDVWSKLSIDISYNPERVSLDLASIQSAHKIDAVVENDGEVMISLSLDSSDELLFAIPIVSDEEYHIVVSDASTLSVGSEQPLAIQRL